MVYVIKSNGERQEFDVEKVRYALERSGASKELAAEIAGKVLEQAKDGISTGKIYGLAYGLLEKQNLTAAAKFSLKQAIMLMGPTGFPFEKYVARLLSARGFKTQTNLVLAGECVTEEIDVRAEKGSDCYMVECKYHNEPGYRTGLKEALYTWARFEDVTGGGHRFTCPWIVTNTKLSDDAIKYATCKRMKMTSWGYPEGESLQEIIEAEGLYPITILVGLGEESRKKLFEAGITLIKDMVKLEDKELIELGALKEDELKRLRQQANELTKGV